ncbi:MAG TPA: ABC transporter permease [Armatimonadota bacterium]|nr:ABC transporter permease [Armatimonadota bacterium]
MSNDAKPPREPRGWLRFFVRVDTRETLISEESDDEVIEDIEPEEPAPRRHFFGLLTRSPKKERPEEPEHGESAPDGYDPIDDQTVDPKRARRSFLFFRRRSAEPDSTPIGVPNGLEEIDPIDDEVVGGMRPRPRRPIFFRVRERLHPFWVGVLSLLPFVIFVAWWFWATQGAEPELRRVTPSILPSPQEVVGRIPELWFDSALMRNILVSLRRALAGLGVAAVIALPLGVLMASFGRIGAMFGLITTLLSYLPLPAIVPLTMFWWGTDEKQKIGFLALGTFAYLLPLVVRRINAVEHKYLLSAYSQGAGPWQVVTKVLVPIALPGIYDAMRLCLGIGWTYIVLAEVIRADDDLGGVGSLIMIFKRLGAVEGVYLTIVAILIVGAILDRAAAWLGKQLFPYRASAARE